MSTTKLFVGLCATCNNATDCVYRKRRGTDAIYCEMFDGYAPPNGKGIAPVVMVTPDIAESTEFKGLCVNCAHRDVCKLPKPKGGVWHCEEYE
jgi:hypothetical protein